MSKQISSLAAIVCMSSGVQSLIMSYDKKYIASKAMKVAEACSEMENAHFVAMMYGTMFGAALPASSEEAIAFNMKAVVAKLESEHLRELLGCVYAERGVSVEADGDVEREPDSKEPEAAPPAIEAVQDVVEAPAAVLEVNTSLAEIAVTNKQRSLLASKGLHDRSKIVAFHVEHGLESIVGIGKAGEAYILGVIGYKSTLEAKE